jgi:hypothetical protein
MLTRRNEKMRAGEVISFLAENFGSPCEYEFDGENASETMEALGGWCQENCPHVDDETCWRAYFKVRRMNSGTGYILRRISEML